MKQMSFEEACRTFIHRYTLEHVPSWALEQASNGKFYAPHFHSDQEWFAHTIFPPKNRRYCQTTNATWPLGKWLDRPLKEQPKC